MKIFNNIKKLFPQKNINILILLVILILGLILRFYNTPDRYGFDFDPTRDALISVYGAENLKLPLTGPSSGVANFTFGPWYYYQLIIFTFLFPFSYAPFYLIGLYSFLFIILMYILGRVIIDEKLGLILAFLAAVSPGQTGPSAGLSNPNLVPVHAALTLILFVFLLEKNRKWFWYLIWGLVIGIGINHHYQMSALLLLPLILFIYKFKTEFKHVTSFLIGFGLSFIPLLIFNINNDWHTLRGVSHYLLEGSGIYVPNSWTIYLKDFWPNFWSYLLGAPIWFGMLIFLITLGIHLYLLIRKKLSLKYILIMGVFIAVFILLRYYSGQREYYYVLFIQPFIFLFVGRTLYSLLKIKNGSYLLFLLIAVIFYYSIPHNLQRLADREDHISFRKEVMLLGKSISNNKYRIYACNSQFNSHILGITYLLKINNSLSSSGEKIGIADVKAATCTYPEQATMIIEGIYLFKATDQQLSKLNWSEVTPQSVYLKYLSR